jgi:hypothetical protein
MSYSIVKELDFPARRKDAQTNPDSTERLIRCQALVILGDVELLVKIIRGFGFSGARWSVDDPIHVFDLPGTYSNR